MRQELRSLGLYCLWRIFRKQQPIGGRLPPEMKISGADCQRSRRLHGVDAATAGVR